METILEKYGWLMMVLYVALKDVLPWTMNRFVPERMKRAQEKEQAKRNAEALVLKNEIDEKEFQRKMQERSTIALEKLGEQVAIQNERLDKLTDVATGTNTFLVQAVTDMRETVAKRRDTQEKMKPVRKAKQ